MLRRPPMGGCPKATLSPYTDSILDIKGINSPIIEGRPKLTNYINTCIKKLAMLRGTSLTPTEESTNNIMFIYK